MRKKLAGVSELGLARFASRVRRRADVEPDVNVLIAGSDEIRELNRRFRHKDKPTDVLSFPSDVPGHGGDIAISYEVARENAKRLGHSLSDELKVLILHGMLHLAGYDHETDDGKMARTEERLRKELKIPHSLIARTETTRSRPALRRGRKR